MNLAQRRIAVVTHVQKTGSLHDLVSVLRSQKDLSVLFITHPLSFIEGGEGSELKLWEGGQVVQRISLPNQKLPSLAQYLRDLLLTIIWVVRLPGRWDVMVAADNLNASAALILRRLGKVRRVVYYTIDFTPQRFGNSRLNDLYHRIDAWCLRHADVTWNISPRIAEGRRNVRGLAGPAYERQEVVPSGIQFDQHPRVEFESIERHALVYSGGLMPHQGLDLVIDAMPLIVAKVPDARLLITGFGPLEDELNDQVTRLGMEDNVLFLGYINDPVERDELVANSAVGIAMYNEALDRWSYYGDPAKIRMYLGAGIPVITTSLTHLAAQITARNAGAVVPFEAPAFANAVLRLLSDDKLLRQQRANAIAFAQEFDWQAMFERALDDPRLL